MLLQVNLRHVLIFAAVLAEVQQHLAQVQSRLGRHAEAWATLTQALDALQSPVLAQAIDSWPPQHSTRCVICPEQLHLLSWCLHSCRAQQKSAMYQDSLLD